MSLTDQTLQESDPEIAAIPDAELERAVVTTAAARR